jgi:imidazolonepropionase-like amidohydrolase
MTDLIPTETFTLMKRKGISYDPTLSVFEAVFDLRAGNPKLLNRSLMQQVGPADLLAPTRDLVEHQKTKDAPAVFKNFSNRLGQNLVNAYNAGVLLVTGTDAGNMLVIHGPTVQHELELWVRAGIPAAVALQAATYNAAKVLHADDRIGSIQKGRDATLVLLEGDPLQDISNTERISQVMFRGERVDRAGLFQQDRE